MTEEPLHTDRGRAVSFGDDPRQYDRSRPRYPDVLIDLLVTDRPESVIDVGCGTGIASRLLRERGCSVLGVEPDGRMAAVARESGIEVEVADFESWHANGRRFDLLSCGQAWHWVDPVVGAHKTAEVLTDGGTFACFWNLGLPTGPVQSALDACYARTAPGIEQYSVLLGRGSSDRVTPAAKAFNADDRFGEIEAFSFPHAVTYTTAAWLDQLETHSDHRALAPQIKDVLFAEIAAVIDGVGGAFEMGYEAVCLRGRRNDR